MKKTAASLLFVALLFLASCPNDPSPEPIGMLPLSAGFKVLELGQVLLEPGNPAMRLNVYDAAGVEETASWDMDLVPHTVYSRNNVMGVDSEGNVYVACRRYTGEETRYDWYLNRYLVSGDSDATHWEKSFDGGFGLDDSPVALVVDSSDNIYVVGYFVKSGTDADWRIKKFSADGIEDTANWNMTVDSVSSPDWDTPSAAAVDSLGNLYVAGTVGSGTVIRKYAANGTEITTVWPLVGVPAEAMSVDALDNLYVAYTSNPVRQFEPAGTPGWISDNVGMYVRGMAIDSSRNVYVVGVQSGGGGRIRKYDTSGVETTTGWNKTLAEFEGINAASVGPGDDLYAAGYFDGGGGPTIWDWRLKKFSSDGTADPSWDKTFDANSGQDEGLSLVTVTIP
jgi:hypothetical protein